MTFSQAIRDIQPNEHWTPERNAAKRPKWGGYVFVTKTSAEGEKPISYTLTFKKRNGETEPYVWNGTNWEMPATGLELDSDLLEAMMAEDWITGTEAEFETARSGSGMW